MADALTENFRTLCEESDKRCSFADFKAVQLKYGEGKTRQELDQFLCARLKALIKSDVTTEISPDTLIACARTFAFEREMGLSTQNWHGVLNALRIPFGFNTYFHPVDHPAWPEAIDIARALLVFYSNFSRFEGRYKQVAQAGKRLLDRHLRLWPESGRLVFDDRELERATQLIVDDFSSLGLTDVLENLFVNITSLYEFWNGMYLYTRNYRTPGRDPSLPFGFLINVAVKAEVRPRTTPDRNLTWQNVITFSRDIVAALDLEPYHQLHSTHIPHSDVESHVRKLALFDSLFTFRQWPLGETSSLLSSFFGRDYDSLLTSKFGWMVSDVIALCESVCRLATKDPTLLTRSALVSEGLDAETLDSLLPHFVHAKGTVNRQYNSPIGAKPDLIFKPLVEVGKDQYLISARSLAGPAFYEATMQALGSVARSPQLEKLRGDGTQRIVCSLFEQAGLEPIIVEKTYDAGRDCSGECDLVLGNDKALVFVECKAKPVTRAAMAGESTEALIDFALSTLESQVQALRHQRILQTNGRIKYRDGTELEFRNRRITRLTVTLLDHGSLQDRMLFWNLFDFLSSSQMRYTSNHPKAEQIDALNSLVQRAREEVAKLEKASVHISVLKSQCASLNVGQLSLVLKRIQGLGDFVKRITSGVTFLSFDPLFEFVHRTRNAI